MLIFIVLGALIGTVLGLTGAGGGILAVPALVVGLGWSMQQATPVALMAVVAGAGIGAMDGLRHKQVRYRAAALMAVAGIPSTLLGLRAAQAMSQQLLLGLFAAVMLLVASRLLWQAVKAGRDGIASSPIVGRVNLISGRFEWNWPTGLLLTVIGALTGFMAGLLGVGGGFVIVPLLRKFTNVSMHGIVATSLLVITIVSLGAVITAVLHGAILPPALTFLFSAATVIGVLVGRYVSHRLSARQVQIGFALTLFAVALGLLTKVVTSY